MGNWLDCHDYNVCLLTNFIFLDVQFWYAMQTTKPLLNAHRHQQRNRIIVTEQLIEDGKQHSR